MAAVAGLATGLALTLAGASAAGNAVLAASSALILVPLSWSVARSLAHRDVGVDGIALVAIAGALVLGEYLVAAVIAVMLAGGNALEASADRRARRELTALVQRMPKLARRRVGETIDEVAVGRDRGRRHRRGRQWRDRPGRRRGHERHGADRRVDADR